MLMAAAVFADDWVLAAEAFTGDETVGTLMPSLILDAIPTSLVHTVSGQEQVFRELLSLEKERSSKQTELDKLITERDAVIFTVKDETSRRDKIAEYDGKIKNLREIISGNLSQTEALENRLLTEESVSDSEHLEENVVLWNKSTDILYKRTDKEPEDIRALITGSVQVRNGFVYVKAGLLVYPGSVVCNEVTVAGSLSDTALIAEEVAASLVDVIVNAKPVSLSFVIGPAAALKNAEVTVDGTNVQNPAGLHAFQSGIHTITVEAPGYEKQIFTRDFSEAPHYRIEVQLPLLNQVSLQLTALSEAGIPARNAQVWIAGRNAGPAPVSVTVNGRQVLGLVQDESGIPTYFAIDTQGSDVSAGVLMRQESSQSRIEKARKSLYTSYGLLLVALPFTFYFYGRMNDAYIAYTSGVQTKSTADEFYKWQKLERISFGVSIVLGGNMIYRMVKYMLAADSVLPETAEPDKEE